MAINYTIEAIGVPGEENYAAGDTQLSSNFNLNSRVNLKEDKIETHFLDLDDNLIDSIYDSVNIQTNQDSGTAVNGSPSTIKLNPKSISIHLMQVDLKCLCQIRITLQKTKTSLRKCLEKPLIRSKSSMKL